MPNTGDESLAPGDVHECWSILPAVAAVTSRLRLGPLVAPTSIHHPALLANRAATLDRLSKGRLILGLGAGWQINEHAAYGIPLKTPGMRVSRFEESIQIVRSLPRQRPDHIPRRLLTTSPMRRPTRNRSRKRSRSSSAPASPRMLRITAQHAQDWNTWGVPELAADRRSVFAESCCAADTDPDSMHSCVQALIFMVDDQRAIDGIIAGEMGNRSIAGSDDHLIKQLGRYADDGFDETIVPDFALGDTAEARLDAYRRFNDDIASQL